MSVNEKMTAIADAIRAKTGGTELLGLDAMAQAIAALETGGGLPEGISALAYGSFMYALDKEFNSAYVTHNLGVTPNFYMILTNDAKSLASNYIVWALGMYGKSTNSRNISYTYRTSSGYYSNNFNGSISAPGSNGWALGYADSTHKYKANKEYMWIIGVWDDFE